MVPALVDGRLPLGRWSSTLAEVEAEFVAGRSAVRREIWNDWMQLTSALRAVVAEIPAAWISGSFLTDREEPADIDCVYLVESWRVLGARIDSPQAAFLQAVASSQARQHFGLSVDSYILEWVPRPGVLKASWAQSYRENRGYWDDLWSRERADNERLDSIPRRGYLEVILDGYA